MKTFVYLQLTWLVSANLLAQNPAPCPSSPFPGADLCQDVCVACNFTGLTSTTAGYTGQTPPGFCGTIENEQWFAFIAAQPAVTFVATPSNCEGGNGIQIALYPSCNANPIVCNGGSTGGGSTPVSVSTAALVPGNVYYLLIDGFAGDQCDFQLAAAPLTAVQSLPPGAPGPIQGPDTLCTGLADTFKIALVSNAGHYVWNGPPGVLINGQPAPVDLPAPGGNKVFVQMGSQPGQICVSASNACYPPMGASCKTIRHKPVSATYTMPPVAVCAANLPYYLPWGQAVSTSGTYSKTYSCDSLVTQQVVVQDSISVVLPPQIICEGDSLSVCGKVYKTGGDYTTVCSSYLGCDSIVRFSLQVVAPIAQILANTRSLTCNQTSLTLSSPPSPGAKTWRNNVGEVVGSGDSLLVEAPGFYYLEVAVSGPGGGCVKKSTLLIKPQTQPPPITAQGGVLSAQNPTVTLQVKCLFNKMQYLWTGPGNFISSKQNPQVSVPGMYTVTVTNPGTGCFSTATVEVTQE